MAFTILSSNRIEILQARLARRLAECPPEDPFAVETVVVPTFAMARWLNLRLAQQQGIAANIDYPQPAEWIWQLARGVIGDLPQRDPYSRDALAWQVFARLPGLLADPPFEALARYLHDDADGIRRWQLAQRIGDGFDRCQAFAPRLVRDWTRGDGDDWQAILWRDLTGARRLPDRVTTIAALIDALERDAAADALPQRVSLFAVSSLAPLYLDVVAALARRTEVDLFLHSPTDQYWADLESERRRSRRRLEQPELDELFESGNELLASWGRQGQVFQDLLLQATDAGAIDTDLFERPRDGSLLGAVQRSIFDLAPIPPGTAADASIAVHVCHSPLRECQVLLDELLALLDGDAALQPEDILVMIPDIATYAPYIEAVFHGRRLAYNVSDTTLANAHPLVTTFLQLIDLPRSRFGSNEVLAFLDNPALCRRFELGERDVNEIHRLVGLARTRWGIDAGHKTEFDIPPTAGNTWQQARERFLAGFAFAGQSLWQDIAPLAGWDDSEAGAIGRFWYFFERLCSWRKRLRQPRGAGDWQALLVQLLDDFFVEYDSGESQMQQIRDAITAIAPADQTSLSPELVYYLMQSQLRAREHSGQLYSGGITFCGMRPMRSIPFEVICLVGMNYDDFPRREVAADFDPAPRQAQAGAPDRRVEDRYLMLETLLCARRRLYFSYTGRSLRDNSERPPSPVLQELLDYIGSSHDSVPVNSGGREALVREQPMQVFASAVFSFARPGYSAYWCEVARELARGAGPRPSAWPRQALPEAAADDSVDLQQLRHFLRHPVQYFFRQRLGLYLEDEDVYEEDETFELGALDRWQIKDELAHDLLYRHDESGARLLASALLAHGEAGRAQLDGVRRAQDGWFGQLREYADSAREARSIELALGDGTELRGIVGCYYPGKGLMAYQAGSFKGSHLLLLWLDHLALHASGGARDGETSRLLANDQRWEIAPLDPADARRQLADYCALYREGLRQPLPVFPVSSHTWASEASADKAMAKVTGYWNNPWSSSYGDRNDAYLELVLRGLERVPLGDADFDRYARRLYAGVLELAQKA